MVAVHNPWEAQLIHLSLVDSFPNQKVPLELTSVRTRRTCQAEARAELRYQLHGGLTQPRVQLWGQKGALQAAQKWLGLLLLCPSVAAYGQQGRV